MSSGSQNKEGRVLTSSGNALAGGIASTLTTGLTYPLDLIRTRFQVHDGVRSNLPQYNSTIKALATIVKTEGFRGLYSGMAPAIVGASASWAMYMFGYSYTKRELEKIGYSSTTSILTGGVLAGMVTATISNPIWVIKTRMQTQLLNAPNRTAHYSSMLDAFKRIYKEEGIGAYYKGLTPAIASSYHGAVQFLIYETIMAWSAKQKHNDQVYAVMVFLAGGVSKAAALLATQPLSVIKARLQEQRVGNKGETPVYHGAKDAFLRTYTREGVRGFYKGVGPAMWRLGLHSAIFFSLLEASRSRLSHFDSLVDT